MSGEFRHLTIQTKFNNVRHAVMYIWRADDRFGGKPLVVVVTRCRKKYKREYVVNYDVRRVPSCFACMF